MAETMSSPFGAKPSQLDSPIPGEQEEVDFFSNINPADFGGLDDVEGEEASVPAQLLTTEQAVEQAAMETPADTFSEANFSIEGIKEQLREASARFRNSFTVTDRESLETLRNTGVFEDVRASGDDILVKRRGAKKFSKLDRDTVELLGDVADVSRDIYEGVIENVGRLGGFIGGAGMGAAEGAAVGSVVPGVGTATGAISGGILSGIAGAAGGGAAGAAFAKESADVFAEDVLGIEPDPARNQTKETLASGLIGGTFGAGAAALGSLVSSKLARRAARLEARGRANVATTDQVKSAVDEAINAIDELKGGKLELAERKFSNNKEFLQPDQLNVQAAPEFNEIAKSIGDEPAFRQARIEQQKILGNAVDTLIDSIGSLSGRKGLGKEFVLSTEDLRAVEGRFIGNFRDKAIKISGDKLQQAEQTSAVALKHYEDFNSYPGDAFDIEDVLQANPSFTTQQAKVFADTLNRVTGKLFKGEGGMTLKEINTEYLRVKTLIDKNMRTANGRAFAQELITIKNGLRADWIEAIGRELPAEAGENYQKSLGRYNEIMGSIDALGSKLKDENISQEALAKWVFDSPTSSLSRMKAVKSLFQESNPELFQAMKGQYIRGVAREAADDNGYVSFKKLDKSLNRMGEEAFDLFIEGSGISKDEYKALMLLGKSVETSGQAGKDFVPTKAQIGLMKRLFFLIPGAGVSETAKASAKFEGVAQFIEYMGKDKAVSKYLTSGGAEEILKDMPNFKNRKGVILSLVEQLEPNKPLFNTIALPTSNYFQSKRREKTREKARGKQ